MDPLHRIAAAAAETNTLLSVLLELTYRCNLDCYFCYNDLAKKGRPLTTERYLELLDELRQLDVLNLTLSGGEPLAHPAFWTIGRRASELAFSTKVKTNGHAVDGDVARRLHDEVRPFLVEVSLHGATPESHDRQTRVPGSFDRLMRNLPAMLEAGLHLKLNSTITTWNVQESAGMFGIADMLGVPLSVNFSVSPRDDGDREPLSIAVRGEHLERVAQQVADRNSTREVARGAAPADAGSERPAEARSGKNCGLGSNTLTVDPFGDVFPCVQWRHPVGNLHRESVREIWFGNEVLDAVRDVNEKAGRMVRSLGDRRRSLAFCPALAMMETGSPLSLYESALQTERAFMRPVPLDENNEMPHGGDLFLPVYSETVAAPGPANE